MKDFTQTFSVVPIIFCSLLSSCQFYQKSLYQKPYWRKSYFTITFFSISFFFFLPLLTYWGTFCTLPTLSLSPPAATTLHSGFGYLPFLPYCQWPPPLLFAVLTSSHFLQCGTSQLKREDLQSSVPCYNSTLMLIPIIVKNVV